MEIAEMKQKDFEYKVCKLLKFNKENSIIMQRDGTEQMILDDLNEGVSELDVLSGTIAYKKKDKAILLVVTKDSEVNHIESITLKMINIIVKLYCYSDIKYKVTLATNIPIDIHSSKAKDLKKEHDLDIKSIGYSFCQKHNLEYNEIY